MPRFKLGMTWIVALSLAPAALWGATTSDAPTQRPHSSLAGQLLVASPTMRDPRFARTVIVMVRHDQDGAMGLVINRPMGERPLAELFRAFGESATDVSGRMRVFLGGPVQPELGFVLHSAEYRRSETVPVNKSIAMTTNRDIFHDIAAGAGPSKSLFAFGYSGWGPGQLEGELAQNAWFIAAADAPLVFDADRDKVWELAVQRRTRDL